MALAPEMDLLLSLASATGIAILSVPAFSLNLRKRSLDRITGIVKRRKPGYEGSALDTIAAELETSASQKANKWRRVDEICLYSGYFLLLGASLLRVLLIWYNLPAES